MHARYLCSDPIELLVLAHLSGEDVNLSAYLALGSLQQRG